MDDIATHNSLNQTFNNQIPTNHAPPAQVEESVFKDPMGRTCKISTRNQREWYIKPHDAKLIELSVQSITEHQQYNANWYWVPLKNKTPLAVKLNMFVFESAPGLIGTDRTGDEELGEDTTAVSLFATPEPSAPNDIWKLRFPGHPEWQLYGRWAFAFIVMLPIVRLPSFVSLFLF
jgi:hypothetical protein